jgi:hypothetical protein
VVVTGADGCSISAQYQITQLAPISLTAIVTQQDCSGNAGSIDITVGGGAGGFAYSWSNGSNSEDVFGLSEGTYTVQVVDSNACVISESFVIDSLQFPIISGIALPDSCGNSIGSIDISVSPVNAAYTYSWSTGSTSEDLTNLTPGMYAVTVTDASQCQSTATFTVGGSIEPVITIEFAVTSDCGAGGSVSVLPGNPSPIATYQWSDGSTLPQLTGVSGGLYSLAVTDVNGCTASGRVEVPQSRPLELSAQVTAAFCSPANSGAVDLTVVSGIPRYTFLWSNGETSEDITQVVAGTYTVVVTDAYGCTSEASYTVGDGCLCPVNFNAQICGPTEICQGESFTLNSVVTPRTQGYPVTYSWTRNPAGFSATTASITQTGLTAGQYTYTLVVTYSPLCTVTIQHTVWVRPRPAITVTNQLTGNNTAATQLAGCNVILNANGGTYYNWTYGATAFPSHTNQLIDNNTAITTSTQLRTYGVVGVDRYGCSNSVTIQVRLTRLTVTGTYSTAPAGPNVTVSGNVPTAFTNATYSWTGPGGFSTTPSTVVRNFSRINLLPALSGTYTATVVQNGCTQTASFTLSSDGIITLLPVTPSGSANSAMLPENETINSDERLGDVSGEEALTFEMFPNPTTDQLRITGETAYPVYTIVRIYDLSGQLVFDSTQGEKQYFNEELNVSSLAPGNYIIVMDCGSSGSWSGRFTKI